MWCSALPSVTTCLLLGLPGGNQEEVYLSHDASFCCCDKHSQGQQPHSQAGPRLAQQGHCEPAALTQDWAGGQATVCSAGGDHTALCTACRAAPTLDAAPTVLCYELSCPDQVWGCPNPREQRTQAHLEPGKRGLSAQPRDGPQGLSTTETRTEGAGALPVPQSCGAASRPPTGASFEAPSCWECW